MGQALIQVFFEMAKSAGTGPQPHGHASAQCNGQCWQPQMADDTIMARKKQICFMMFYVSNNYRTIG